jgi:hypothetical protein
LRWRTKGARKLLPNMPGIGVLSSTESKLRRLTCRRAAAAT